MTCHQSIPSPLSESQVTLVQLAGMAETPQQRLTFASVRCAEPFDAETFAGAVTAVVMRHAALRAAIDISSGQQLSWAVAPAVTPSMTFVDLRHLPLSSHATTADEAVAAAGAQPFDINQPSLIRFVGIRVTDTDTVIHTVSHPALLDRAGLSSVHWSIMQQIGASLARPAAEADGDRHPVDEDEHARPETPDIEAERADLIGWVQTFAGFAPSTPQLWATRPRDCPPPDIGSAPRHQPAGRSSREMELPGNLVDNLVQLADHCGASVEDTLMAVHVKAVAAATGRNDLVVGWETGGNGGISHPRLGSRTRTVPVRVAVQAGTWADLVVAVRAARDAGRPFQGLSYLRLLRALDCSRLLDATFSYCEDATATGPTAGDGREASDAGTDVFRPFVGAAHVEFGHRPAAGPMVLRITAGRDFADEQVLELLRLHVAALAHCAVADQPHNAMPLIDVDQRELMLRGWNGPARAYPVKYCVHELVEQQSLRTPDRLAVVDRERQLTYQALNARANQLAHQLRGIGISAGAVVGICARRSASLIVAFLAVMKSGAAYLPLEPRQPAERLAYLIQDAGVAAVLTDATYGRTVPDGPWNIVDIDDIDAAQPKTNPSAAVRPDDLMYVIYTSGSTGLPKGVEVPHFGVVNYLGWCKEAYAIGGDGGAALFSSVAFDMVVPNVYTPLIMGQRLFVVDDTLAMSEVADRLRMLAPFSFLKLTPGQLGVLGEFLTPEAARELASTLVVGADAFPVRAMRSWRRADPETPMLNEYGPTEASVGNCVYAVTGDEQGELLPIGTPIPNTTMYVLDDTRALAPVGTPGELYIGGACVVRGYANRPDLTEQRFHPDPFADTPGARMYRTGDIGRWLPDGNLEFLGRIDDQVKIRGYRVEPAEVEAAIVEHPSIVEAVVTVTGQTRETLALVGYYVGDADLSADALRDFLGRRLPDYLVPQLLIAIPAVPLNANGKVDRRALPPPSAGKAARRRQQIAADGQFGQLLQHAWRKALGREPAGIDERIASADTAVAYPTLLALHLARADLVAAPAAFRMVAESITFGELAERFDRAVRSVTTTSSGAGDER